jgi:hypothetical protein
VLKCLFLWIVAKYDSTTGRVTKNIFRFCFVRVWLAKLEICVLENPQNLIPISNPLIKLKNVSAKNFSFKMFLKFFEFDNFYF